jgi:amino acid adenylation domain-containing protein
MPSVCDLPTQINVQPDDLAYILYTSGSTGRPKGVMLSHRNATSFVHWCSEVFSPSSQDRFSSHAPLHFDLSILDLYVNIKHAATLILIDETTAKSPGLLTELVARERITVWYSTPSVLTLWLSYGRIEQHDLRSLRLVLFAGEVFPVKHLRALKERLPCPVFFNLYGPTETNVCTFFKIPETIPVERTTAFPIGKACSHLLTRVLDETGSAVLVGTEGELCVYGPAVTAGYWNLPEQTASCFWIDSDHRSWYKTGDVVVELPDGNYQFQGRRDRMIKRRGHRVELGEIEACLVRHPAIQEVAAVVRNSLEGGGVVVAVLVTVNGQQLSQIQLKRFCSENLPASMIPDQFEFRQRLPKTSTDKIDYQELVRASMSPEDKNS